MTPDPDPLPAAPPFDARAARRADALLGLGVAVLGAALALVVVPLYVRSPVEPRPLPMAPWFLPTAAAWLMAASGLALAVGAWRRPRPRGGEGGGEPLGLLRAGTALAAYVALMPVLGAMTTGVLVTLALTLTSEGMARGPAVLTALLVPALAWAMFTQLAGTPLPRGPWGLP